MRGGYLQSLPEVSLLDVTSQYFEDHLLLLEQELLGLGHFEFSLVLGEVGF